jgi:hypothetical protein
MSKPHIHSKSSARTFGGKPEDYQDIHDFMDSSKSCIADARHRAMFHHAFGCFVVEKVFGTTRVNSDGKEYSTRDVAEKHIIEDLGHIPSFQDFLKGMPIEEWMGGKPRKERETFESTEAPVVQGPAEGESNGDFLARREQEFVDRARRESAVRPSPLGNSGRPLLVD